MDDTDFGAAPADWYDGFFEREWLDVIALATPDERTQQQVDFILERLALAPGASVLDLACGHGRITLELARRGFRATGLDLSARSLELARAAAKGEGLDVEWIHADMRELPAGARFDAVINVNLKGVFLSMKYELPHILATKGAIVNMSSVAGLVGGR